VLLAGGAAWWLTRTPPAAPPQPLEVRLNAALARVLPGTTSKYREEVTTAFAQMKMHRAMAVAQQRNGTFRTQDWPTREIAEEKALEKCQVGHDEPCAVIAVNGEVMTPAAGATLPVRDAARARYVGLFNPERIPGVRPAVVERPEVAGYATAKGAKAAAYHHVGVLHVVAAAPSQRAAEEQALAACNRDPVRREAGGGPCLLYAVDTKVVLPLRATAPMTAAPTTAATPTTPP
jgi:hypothetical protein